MRISYTQVLYRAQSIFLAESVYNELVKSLDLDISQGLCGDWAFTLDFPCDTLVSGLFGIIRLQIGRNLLKN